MQTSNICIYFADTGGGHRSAASAIEAGIKQTIENEFPHQNVNVVKKAVLERSHPITHILTVLYNHLARHHTTWVKYYYRMLHMICLESDAYYWMYHSYIHKLLQTDQPSLIVCVHPMLANCLTRALKELHMDSVKLAVVITDPNEKLWRAWGCPRADLIIVPNNIVSKCLINWKISPDKIQVLGMPVHPKFIAPPTISRKEFLPTLGLSSEVFTVCINSSWAGNKHLMAIYKALAKSKCQIQVIFLSGYNQRLYQEVVNARYEMQIPTAVLPFYDNMPDLMNAVDVMVTKAGGLTIYEALARRLPVILDKTIEPMPQEAPTMEMLVRIGMAKEITKPNDIVNIVESIKFRRQQKTPLTKQYQLNLTDEAIFDISRRLLYLYNSQIYINELMSDVA